MNLPDRTWPGSAPDLIRQERRVPQPAPQSAEPEDFVETLRKLARHKKLVLGSILGAAALGLIAAALLPVRYTAEARVLVGISDPKSFNLDIALSDVRPDAEQAENESFVLRSRTIARKVIDRLHLETTDEFNPDLAAKRFDILDFVERHMDPAITEWIKRVEPDRKTASAAASPAFQAERTKNRIIDAVLSQTDVMTMGRSHVLGIRVQSRNPETAASIANTMADVYLSQQLDDKSESTDRIEQYMDDRIKQLRSQVEASEQAVESYRREHRLYNGETANLTSQQLTEMNSELVTAQTAKVEAEAHLADAMALSQSGMDGDSVPDVLNSPSIQALKVQQAEAERRLAELSANYGNMHPKVIDARAEIQDIQRKLQTEMSRVVASLRHQARTANARFSAIQANFEHTKTRMGGVSQESIHLEALERDATVNRKLLESMLTREKEMIGQQALQQPNAKLISPAVAPDAPSFPPRFLIVALSALAGLLGSSMVVLLKESVDQTFRGADQVERQTGLPVISLVPALRRGSPSAQVLENPLTPFAESLRRIYLGMQISETRVTPKSMILCSATPSEGKSAMAAALGRLLSSEGKRVVIIDCDWRYPCQHRIFRTSNRYGLASLLMDEGTVLNDCIHHDPLSGLDVIPCGFAESLPVHMLVSERMQGLIHLLSETYDLVILDAAPILVGGEVVPLSRLVDKVVYTIRWGHTSRREALQGLRRLVEGGGGNIFGIALSRVDPKKYRYYGYGPLAYDHLRPAPDMIV